MQERSKIGKQTRATWSTSSWRNEFMFDEAFKEYYVYTNCYSRGNGQPEITRISRPSDWLVLKYVENEKSQITITF